MMSDNELPYCDVVMKGGITSGVVYPPALARLAKEYRFHSLGGASAGAIGAALGAAAEHNRSGGGFDRLVELTRDLENGGLEKLFQPQPSTRRLLGPLLAAAGFDKSGRKNAGRAVPVAIASAAAYRLALSVGIVLTIVLIGLGALSGSWIAAVLGLALGLVGIVIAVGIAVYRDLTRAVPENAFGICTGLGTPDQAGFTDWLSRSINTCAGRDPQGSPLTFGDLWRGPEYAAAKHSPEEAERVANAPKDYPDSRIVDLRMITTCISHGTPYELPFGGRNFFFNIDEWTALFPAEVMQALLNAPVAAPTEQDGPGQSGEAAGEAQDAAGDVLRLRRLPVPTDLPIVVAMRMSLSFPLLISAVPMYEIDYSSKRTGEPLTFRKLWFTDGGLCSNFPLHLFDEALPTRRTFAINLDRFASDDLLKPDEADNVDLPTTNKPRLPHYRVLAASGRAAIGGFGAQALDAARNWQDNSYLQIPGYRDRIVRVQQTSAEGGLNLFMDSATVRRLGERGTAAADKLIRQFETNTFPNDRTGWDNHRWIRYRALLAALRPFASSYVAGRAALDIDSAYPSYPTPTSAAATTAAVDSAMSALSNAFTPGTVSDQLAVTNAPKPLTRIRRTSGMP